VRVQTPNLKNDSISGFSFPVSDLNMCQEALSDGYLSLIIIHPFSSAKFEAILILWYQPTNPRSTIHHLQALHPDYCTF
jgi:hypothetical protein